MIVMMRDLMVWYFMLSGKIMEESLISAIIQANTG